MTPSKNSFLLTPCCTIKNAFFVKMVMRTSLFQNRCTIIQSYCLWIYNMWHIQNELKLMSYSIRFMVTILIQIFAFNVNNASVEDFQKAIKMTVSFVRLKRVTKLTILCFVNKALVKFFITFVILNVQN